MSLEPNYQRFPKVPIQRRVAAFGIDFVVVWLFSSFVAGIIVQMLAFLTLWLGLRVVLVSSNHGQSLGRWALDMKVLEAKDSRIPELLALTKREAFLGFCAFLAMLGLSSGLAGGGFYLLLLSVPLAVDCGAAFTDAQAQQALHDRLAQTVIIQTQRGFSLDLRLKRLVAQISRRMK